MKKLSKSNPVFNIKSEISVRNIIASIFDFLEFEFFIEMPSQHSLISVSLAETFSGTVIVGRSLREAYIAAQKELPTHANLRVDFTDPTTFLFGLKEELQRDARILFYFDVRDWMTGRDLVVNELSDILAEFPNSIAVVNDLGIVLGQEVSRQPDGPQAEFPGSGLAGLIGSAYVFSDGAAQNLFKPGGKVGVLTTNADYAELVNALPSLSSLENWSWDELGQALASSSSAPEADAPMDEFIPVAAASRAVMPVTMPDDCPENWNAFLTRLSKEIAPADHGPTDHGKEGESESPSRDLILPTGVRLEKIFKDAGAFNEDQIQLFEQIFFPMMQRLDQAISVENDLRSQLLQSEYKTIVAENELRDARKRYEQNEKAQESGDKLKRHIINDLEQKLVALKNSRMTPPEDNQKNIQPYVDELRHVYSELEKIKQENLTKEKALSLKTEELNILKESFFTLRNDLKLISASRWVKIGIKLGLSKLQNHLSGLERGSDQ